MNWMDDEDGIVSFTSCTSLDSCTNLDELSIKIQVVANNRAGKIVISTVDMKLKSGDEVDAGFFTGLVQEALEKAANSLGGLASIAATGAMTGAI